MSSRSFGVKLYSTPAIHCCMYGVLRLGFTAVAPKPTSCNPPAELPVGRRSPVGKALPQGAKTPVCGSQATVALPLNVDAGLRPLLRLVIQEVDWEKPSLGP